MTPFDDPQAELAWMFLQSMCEGGDLDEGFALLSDDFTFWSIASRVLPATRRPFGAGSSAARSGLEVNIDLIRCVNEGETVVVEGEVDGVTGDGTKYDSPFVCIFETRDGMIVSLREYSDTQSLARVFPVSLHDADLGLVGVEGDVPGDRRDRGIRLLVGPDRILDGVAGRGGHAVVAGVAFERAVAAGVGAGQPLLNHVAQRNVLHHRQSGFPQFQRRGGVGDQFAVDVHLDPSLGRLDGDRMSGVGFFDFRVAHG